MVREAYHTALRSGQVVTAVPCHYYEDGPDVAFVNDVLEERSLPAEYERADVIFSDCPWPAGFARFEHRAGINGNHPPRSWLDLLEAYIAQVQALDKPFVFSMNRSKHPELPQPDTKVPGRLNGARCMLWCYGIEVAGGDVVDVLHDLAERYETIGDPMCGYGRSGRIFNEHHRNFVMSDYNPFCIGYIAAHAASWRK
jgi:hypothetical protein